MDTDHPLLLVHGYMDQASSSWWDDLEDELLEHGYTGEIERADLSSGSMFSWMPGADAVPGTTVSSPEQYASELADQVDALYDEYDAPVNIIAHSMGGLDARWYIEEEKGNEKVDTLVTVGTPHQGTRYSYLGLHTGGGRAMRPGSSFLEELNDDGIAEDVEYTAVWTPKDEVIRPPENATLPYSDESIDQHKIETDIGLFPVYPSSLAHVNLLRDPDAIETWLEQ